MEFANLQFSGINLGPCGPPDLYFLRKAAIAWPELTDAITTGRVKAPLSRPPENQYNADAEDRLDP
jgi:hypothetical protein